MPNDKISKETAIKSILKDLKKGIDKKIILEKLIKNYKISVPSFYNYYKEAEKEYKAFKERVTPRIEAKEAEAIGELRKAEILSKTEALNLLTSFAKGSVSRKKHLVVNGKLTEVNAPPAFSDSIKSIENILRIPEEKPDEDFDWRYISKVSEVNPVYLKTINSLKKYILNVGGTRSGKTYNYSQIAVDWLMTGKIGNQKFDDKGIFDIFRTELTTLKATVAIDIDKIISERDLWNKIEKKGSSPIYYYKHRMIRLMSSTDSKALGSSRDVVWFNEADEMPVSVVRQVLFRGPQKVLFDLNPANPNSWIVSDFEKEGAPYYSDTCRIHSTFKDNLFLPEYVIEEIERLKFVDDYLYNVYTLGLYAEKKGVIFKKPTKIKDGQDIGEILGGEYYLCFAMDYGTTDPTVLLAVYIPKDITNRKLYVEQLFYSPDPDLETLKSVFENYKSTRGIKENHDIIVDNAAKTFIESLNAFGISAVPCRKTGIQDGIFALKSREIITNDSSSETFNEFLIYRYVTAKDGSVTQVPIDKNNHAIDTIRYAQEWIGI